MTQLNLYLYNTITKRKDKFIPIDSTNVRMYVCGPTVYDRPHIGNIRSAVVYDVLYRLLKLLYLNVTYVRNITDIDDKIIAASVASGTPIQVLTEQMTKFYEEDVASVLCLSPTISPKATHHLNEMFEMIQNLIQLGHAYEANGHVLFRISSYKNYGFLSRRSMDEMIAGARIEIATFKEHPADFVLWKPVLEYGFDSPWGYGRPGWHIECSAMSTKHLGNNFDIHGGGVDLVFPHHENEVAQAVCSNKGSNFANVWVHNGFLTVNGEKMSKSLNNFTLLKDLLDQEIPGPVIRYFYLMTHYRKPIDFNDNAIHAANKSLNKLATIVEPIFNEYNFDLQACDLAIENLLKKEWNSVQEFVDILCNDMNTPGVLSALLKINSSQRAAMVCTLLGFSPSVLYNYRHSQIDPYILELAQEREQAKAEKNWTIADSIRNDILMRGYNIMDQKSGGFKVTKK